MKKIAFLLAVGVAVLGMSSCKQNTEPKYRQAYEGIQLNTPALAGEYYELYEGGTINITWSQPDWGFAAAAIYSVEISFDEDFPYNDDGTPSGDVYTLPTTFVTCNADVPMKDIAEGMSSLRGISDIKDWTPDDERTLFIRVCGYVPQIEGSLVWSNYIKLDHVLAYAAVRQPNKIYLVGKPEGWLGPEESNAAHYDEWALVEQVIDEHIYYGSFNINAGGDEALFRFYTKLTGWETDSWGSPDGPDSDTPVEYDYAGGTFQSSLRHTKDSFKFPNWPGGVMNMVANFAEEPATLTITSE